MRKGGRLANLKSVRASVNVSLTSRSYTGVNKHRRVRGPPRKPSPNVCLGACLLARPDHPQRESTKSGTVPPAPSFLLFLPPSRAWAAVTAASTRAARRAAPRRSRPPTFPGPVRRAVGGGPAALGDRDVEPFMGGDKMGRDRPPRRIHHSEFVISFSARLSRDHPAGFS